MKKSLLSCFFTLLLSFACLQGQTPVQKFYIDFGQNNPNEGRHTTGTDAGGNYWNNVIAPNGSPSTLGAGLTVNLNNAENTPTAYALEVARAIQSNGGANGGLATPDTAFLGDLAVGTATEDYFFLADNGGKGLFIFKNLDTDKAYKFYIYGCRTAAGAQRGIIYSVSGKNGSHGKQLNTGTGIGANGYDGNNNNVWESTPVIPAANGEIMLELGRLFNNQMGYISALKMEEISGYDLPAAEKKFFIDFGRDNSGLDGSLTPGPDANGNYWNNMYVSGGDGSREATGLNISPLVYSDSTASACVLELASRAEFNGVRNGGLLAPDAALLGDLAVATATHDYLFINLDNSTSLKFKNLNTERRYRFNIFGSRGDNGDRIGRITLAGSNSVTGIHQTSGSGVGANGYNGNNKNIFVSDPVIPDAGGEIILTLDKWLGMAHINCMKIEELSGEELPTATGISIVGGSSITDCGGSLQLTVAATPQGALSPPVIWSVDSSSIARITITGKLYAIANGTVTVIALATLENETELTDTIQISISGQNIGNYSFTVMGSSVPWGQGAEPREVNGYAWLWTNYLQNNAVNNWTTNNISIGGNTTTDVTNRWDSDLLPSCSRYVYYGLSLGNEGIHERGQAAFNSWRDNMTALIERTRQHGKIPVVGNNYPRGDFNAADYNFVKQLNLLIHQWDAPSVNLLGAIDDGAGRWAYGYMADNAHPNTAGHAELFYAIVPSLLDAVAAEKPQPARNPSASITLEKNDKVKSIVFTPEGTLHSFTLSFSFKTTNTGAVAAFKISTGDTLRVKIDADGKLHYYPKEESRVPTKTTAAVNDGNWHTASITHYYAWGRTKMYVDGVEASGNPISEKLVPVKFFLNDFDNAPQTVDYRDLFLHRAGMCAEEITAMHEGAMLKSSLEIYAPLSISTAAVFPPQIDISNYAQSLNTLQIEEQEIVTGIGKTYFNNMEIIETSVYSISGQKLFCTFGNFFDYTKKLSAGIYIARSITAQGEVLSQKIVME
ncbi:MAG: GDSL-type esterase/lipase family protein [Paludibacter sp.]|jgi:lysophospholipase L1-like esterase|nr:GDSL-type esterase/lipase family protein [Paludibacter sp.]